MPIPVRQRPMPQRARLVLVAIGAAWALAGPHAVSAQGVGAQAPDGPGPRARPRIGLVLSGGGARGAAHVGVIRALERMHIPVDAVAGTSMGAVVGGLYAAGLSGDQIDAVFRELDWQDLLRDRAPRRDLIYRRKRDDRNILAKGALGVRPKEGVVLPLGLVQGQKITQVLRNATLSVTDVHDFDKLPTPFRALATDLETGEPVVLRSGDLATVLRASMSAPGLLAPVEIDGRLLVDGGLVDNLPVALARQMGVDILIVVDVSFPLATREGLQSPLDVTNQTIGIMVRRGTLESKSQLRANDVLIEPDLGRMTSFEFARVPQVMDAGETAVVAVQDRLATLAMPEAEYAQYVAARARPADPAVKLAFVRPGPRSEPDAARIDAVFGDMAGAPLKQKELQRRLKRQYGLDRFESVDYRLVREDDDTGLEVDLQRKSWGPNYLRLGVGVVNDFSSGATANAGARLLLTELNRLDAEWLIDAQLGEEPRLATEFFQPLALDSPFFVAPGFRYNFNTLQLVQGSNQIARFRVRETLVSLAVGAELAEWGEVRGGVRYGDGSNYVLIGNPSLPRGTFNVGGAYLEFGYDQLDSAYFPKHGQAFRADWLADRRSLGADVDADIVRASWQFARTRDRNSLVISMDAGSALNDRVNSPLDLFTLGGLFNLSGLIPDSLTGTQYAIARAIVYRRISRGGTGFFEFPAYVGMSVEAGNVWQRRDDVNLGQLQTAGSVFLGAESPFGPIYLATGLAEGGQKAFYLYLGKTF